ncbi:unnamed protein product [Owenia fusiformis]|uniref:Uncharacterized protein n=1 Tax=Owenia fusiformis TaxID=6347 RepID=A0A8J1UTA0_OWEFU|nr:unnamed protein product [Owenia fusiformis]
MTSTFKYALMPFSKYEQMKGKIDSMMTMNVSKKDKVEPTSLSEHNSSSSSIQVDSEVLNNTGDSSHKDKTMVVSSPEPVSVNKNTSKDVPNTSAITMKTNKDRKRIHKLRTLNHLNSTSTYPLRKDGPSKKGSMIGKVSKNPSKKGLTIDRRSKRKNTADFDKSSWLSF